MSNHQQELFYVYEQVKTLTENYQFEQDKFQDIAKRFEEKKQNPELSIMVYGVYNAGKSTLINALIGQELAAMDDVPLTNAVDVYQYQNYKIQDTPGIDAPIEHEKVADEQLTKSDVVIFVVNPLGTVEEQATLDKLMDLFEKRIKVFLVFNEKNQLSEEDFIKLKDQTRQTLQQMAIKRGLTHDILGDIPIYKVNAKRALNGKIQNKNALVHLSGINQLEQALNAFIDETLAKDDVYHSLKNSLLDFINAGIDTLQQPKASDLKRLYDKLTQDVRVKKIQLQKDIKDNIKNRSLSLQNSVESWIFNEVPNLEQNYTSWIEQQIAALTHEAQGYCEEIATQIQTDIDNLEVHIPKVQINQAQATIDTSHIDDGKVNIEPMQANPNNDNIKDALSMAAKVLPNAVRPEHVVGMLQMVKSYLPSLMKGIGPAKMGNMAGAIIGRIAPALAIATIAYDAWSAYQQSQQAAEANRQMQTAQQQAIERRNAQIKDTARQVADDFGLNLDQGMLKMIDEFFQQFFVYLEDGKRAFSEQEQRNTTLLAQLTELRQKLL